MMMLDRKTIDGEMTAPPDPIGSEADRWSLRLADGPLAADEARAFNQWMAADPAHEQAFQAAQALRHELAHVKDLRRYDDWMKPSRYERIASGVHQFRQKLQSSETPKFRLAAIGGAATLASAAMAMAIISAGTFEAPSTIQAEPPLVTHVAEVKNVTLPDGSIVTIGAASSVSIAYTEEERRVILSEGEAFFDVQEDPERPFIVAAQNTMVRVLGTKFDVSLGIDAIDVAVSEGRVEVIRPDAGRTEIRESDVKHVLIAGQKVTTPKRGRVEPVKTIKVEDVAAWRRGELVWADTPLKDIVADLNRYSEDGIELRAGSVANLEYTLAVQADDIPAAVDLIAASLGLNVDEQNDGKLVLRVR